MSLSLKIESAEFTNALRKLTKHVAADAERLIRNESGLLAQQFQKRTPPFEMKTSRSGKWQAAFSTTTKAKEKGEGAVKRDIKYLIKGFDPGFLDSMEEWWGSNVSNRKFTTKAGKVWVIDQTIIARRFSQLRRFHQSKRSKKRGNVPMATSRRQSINIGRHTSRDKMFTTHKALDNYIKSRQKYVGYGASGWNAAVLGLRRTVPKWIKRHGTQQGFFREEGKGTRKYVITMGSRVAYFPRYKETVVIPSMRQQARSIEARIRRIIQKGADTYKFRKGV